jgi:GT2 family glycosyltransferase
VQALVSVVVLNWNGSSCVRLCLEHLLSQTYENIEIIVVDNGSTDGSAEIIEKEYPDLRVIRNERNLGFCTGMNQGIAESKGQYTIPLNFDAFLDKDFVKQAIQAIQGRSEKIGMVASKVFRFAEGQKTQTVSSVGLFLLKRMALANSKNADREEFVFGPHGCCPVLQREMLEQVQLSPGEYFDDTYFAFGEDTDLWFRAQLRGWKCLFTPRAVAWHVHSGSLGGQVKRFDKPPVFQRHSLKNRYLTIIKDFPVGVILYIMPYLITADCMLWVYLLLRRPRIFFSVLLPAMLDVVRLLPQALEKRSKILRGRETSFIYLKGLFI